MSDPTAPWLPLVQDAGWAEAVPTPLAGDASPRRYLRLTRADGARAIVMDASRLPAAATEAWLTVARFLADAGLRPPAVLARDPARNCLLIEDFGDETFARRIAADPARAAGLNDAALEVLARLHAAPVPPPPLPVYGPDEMAAALAPFFDWYGPEPAPAPARAAIRAAMRAALAACHGGFGTVALRDFHAENLVWVGAGRGTGRVGLLDFQDAVLCHPAYDLASLLRDARRDVDSAEARRAVARFAAMSGHDAGRLAAAFAVMAVQRNLRILGIFARLIRRDARPRYRAFLPRVWAYLAEDLAAPGLDDLRRAVAPLAPPPDPARLPWLEAR